MVKARPKAAPGTLADILRIQIEQGIYSGEFQLGEALDEKVLAERFSTSRTPVRDALHQLSARGLVTIVPRSGYFVAKLEPRRVLELLEMHAEMEGAAAELASRRMSKSDRSLLRQCQEDNQRHVDALDPDGYRDGNRKFHDIIYRACANELIVDTILDIRKRLGVYRRDPFLNLERIPLSHMGHGEIAQAIIAGDGPASRRAMIAHISGNGQHTLDTVLLAS